MFTSDVENPLNADRIDRKWAEEGWMCNRWCVDGVRGKAGKASWARGWRMAI